MKLLPFGRKRKSDFEELLLPHLDGLYGAALRLTRHDRDAEDLVQETVARALRFFDTFQTGTNFKAWVFRILTNTFINQYRRDSKAKTFDTDSERDSVNALLFSGGAADSAQHPEEAMVARLMSADVLQAVDTLPVDFRMVVVLADLQEFSYREIADVLGIPIGTVMSRLFRGRKMLQERVLGASLGTRESDADVVSLEAYRQKSGS